MFPYTTLSHVLFIFVNIFFIERDGIWRIKYITYNVFAIGHKVITNETGLIETSIFAWSQINVYEMRVTKYNTTKNNNNVFII